MQIDGRSTISTLPNSSRFVSSKSPGCGSKCQTQKTSPGDLFNDWFQEYHDFKLQQYPQPSSFTHIPMKKEQMTAQKTTSQNYMRTKIEASAVKVEAPKPSGPNPKKRKADEALFSKVEDVEPPKKMRKSNEGEIVVKQERRSHRSSKPDAKTQYIASSPPLPKDENYSTLQQEVTASVPSIKVQSPQPPAPQQPGTSINILLVFLFLNSTINIQQFLLPQPIAPPVQVIKRTQFKCLDSTAQSTVKVNYIKANKQIVRVTSAQLRTNRAVGQLDNSQSSPQQAQKKQQAIRTRTDNARVLMPTSMNISKENSQIWAPKAIIAKKGACLQENFQTLNITDVKAKVTLNTSNSSNHNNAPIKFLYEPCKYSSRLLRVWEHKNHKNWYNLSPNSRHQANIELEQLQREANGAMQHSNSSTQLSFKGKGGLKI